MIAYTISYVLKKRAEKRMRICFKIFHNIMQVCTNLFLKQRSKQGKESCSRLGDAFVYCIFFPIKTQGSFLLQIKNNLKHSQRGLKKKHKKRQLNVCYCMVHRVASNLQSILGDY